MSSECRLRVDLTYERTALQRVLVEVLARGMDVASLSFSPDGDDRTLLLSIDPGSMPEWRAIALIERLVPVRSVTRIEDDAPRRRADVGTRGPRGDPSSGEDSVALRRAPRRLTGASLERIGTDGDPRRIQG